MSQEHVTAPRPSGDGPDGDPCDPRNGDGRTPSGPAGGDATAGAAHATENAETGAAVPAVAGAARATRAARPANGGAPSAGGDPAIDANGDARRRDDSAAGDGSAAGYRPRRTLPLWVEFVRQARRRRTMVVFGLLAALPWILVAAFTLIPSQARPAASALRTVDLATDSAINFAIFVLWTSASFLLVVAVAVFCGDSVASEANWSSLRYLLAAPVPRDRLLRQKLTVALAYAAAAVVTVPVMALIAGTLAFGWNDVRLPGTGESVAAGEALPRFAIVVGYTLLNQLVVAALAFLLSATTDSPLGAVGGAVGLVIVSNIVQAVEDLGELRQFLPTYWNTAWLDVLAIEVDWGGMARGAALSVTYGVLLMALAFRRFRRKDIVS
ncbi:ABC transporter permease [Sinosporangium siamense]|uniref:ABC-2 type transport system permease protein n=1 Tax=Sinosporangium siamense TaxID=1367973 RepID=A0A919RH59_9ACTN|nr:ABC transporter permease subunit [Sinosporangium siamense]GII91886.1 hypothetical protein Ssi02_21170 [Sinosporangium siamense]